MISAATEAQVEEEITSTGDTAAHIIQKRDFSVATDLINILHPQHISLPLRPSHIKTDGSTSSSVIVQLP